MFKKLRFWLASKIICAEIIPMAEALGEALEIERQKWEREQLALGNTITLQYMATPISKITIN